MKEILDEEIENVKIKFYGYLEFVKDRIIERMSEESEEEIKKFTEGFAYNAPQEKFDPEKHEVINHNSPIDEFNEGMNKFRENFDYKRFEKKQWYTFNEKIPDSQTIWVKEESPYVQYSGYHDEEDIESWKESGALWQYAYPPELPEKKEEHLTCKRIGSRITLMCRQDCNSLILSIFDSHHSTMLCEYVKFCPICGFSVEDKDEMDSP